VVQQQRFQRRVAASSSREESLLIHNARIYLFDESDTIADAILIDHGRVTAAGPEDELRRRARGAVENWNAHGATILPGLIDTHPHLLHFAARRAGLVDIATAVSHDDIVHRIAEHARNIPPGKWIMTTPVGEPHYFIRRSHKDLKERELPDRHVLDRASDSHPIAIAAWEPNIPNTAVFNSLALAQLGITRDRPDHTPGVLIERDERREPSGRIHGAINGVFSGNEFAYQLWRKIPVTDFELVGPATRRAISNHHKLGITAVYENHMMQKWQIELYRQMRRDGELTMRVATALESDSFGSAWSRPRTLDRFVRGLNDAASSIELTDDLFRLNGVSVQWDGGCYPGAMMMRDPYYGPDSHQTYGQYMMDPNKIELAMRFCAKKRIRLNTLCVGTQAHEENLRMLEGLTAAYDIRPLRWILVHTPFIEQEQVERYRRLNFDVTTTMTFLFGTGDLFRKRFKPHRCEAMLQDLLPLRRYFECGMTVSGGTDWGPKSVFEHIQLAQTHTTPSGYCNLGRAQQISRTQAVSMWTRDAGRLLRWKEIGSLSPGAHADLVILDRDPIRCAVAEIADTKVLRTVFAGATVYDTGLLT
jgi:predicted amidohydrolase YtcJ